MSDAYKKVIGGGLKFKGGQSGQRPLAKKGTVAAAPGTAKALGLQHATFKKEAPTGSVKREAAGEEEKPSEIAPSAAAAATSGLVAPGAGSKADLRAVDANLTALRDADRQLDRLDPEVKRARILAEKRAAEEAAAQAQLSNHVNAAALAPGVKFSMPNLSAAANLKAGMYRRDLPMGHASARLDERAKKKSDRYCK